MNGASEKRQEAAALSERADQSAGSSTQGQEPREEVPGLPRLNYNLLEHKWKLSIVTFLLVLESSLLPIALFYGLWFGTTIRHGIRKPWPPPSVSPYLVHPIYRFLVPGEEKNVLQKG